MSFLHVKINLYGSNLFQKAIIQAARMLEEFYPYHVLQRLPISEKEFWEKQQLDVNDWKGMKFDMRM